MKELLASLISILEHLCSSGYKRREASQPFSDASEKIVSSGGAIQRDYP